MAYLDNLFGAHLDNLQQALGRATERQALLTGNLVNVDTPGYKRKDLDFNIVLKDEMGRNTPSFGTQQSASSGIKSDGTSAQLNGNNVDLEHEVMSIAETELRYQSLTEMTSRYFSNLKYVIREGK